MTRHIVIATTAILYLCSGIAPAQQTQQTPPSKSSGAAGTSSAGGAAGSAGKPAGPAAGRSVLGVTIVEMETVILGWSARKDLLGKTVINDAREKIGEVEDIIITPDNAASYAIIGIGGFLGIGEHRVAIPFQQIRMKDTTLILPGATRDALKALPEFKYTPRKK